MLPVWGQENLVCLVHVKPCYCVDSMTSVGEIRIHKSNGTYVGITKKPDSDETVLLMCCPDKTHKIKENKFPGIIPLASSEDSKPLLLEEEKAGQVRSGGILWVVVHGKDGFRKIMSVLASGQC